MSSTKTNKHSSKQASFLDDLSFLEGLNEEQNLAVTQTEGPTLILAGAGTGKTRVITHRLAYLLETKKDLRAENILALTYTKKAAAEMTERIEALLPPMAGVPQIMTYHSFALELVQEYALQLGLSPKTKLLTNSLQRAALLEPLLWQQPLEAFSKVSKKESLVLPFLRFIDRAKDELATPQDLKEYVREQREALALQQTSLDEEVYEEQNLELQQLEQTTEVFSLYEQQCLENESIDFGGLIQVLVQALMTKPTLTKKLSEKFQYILVDEFQDTNMAQIELLKLLSEHHKNICAVGDDDQAIYRFRGASYASFKKFREIFPDTTLLKLSENYRSSENILSAADISIKNNGKDRYDEIKVLKTQNPSGEKVSVHTFNNYDSEALWIADEIKGLKDSSKDYSDIAILIRAHSHGKKIKEALKQKKIPFVEAAGTKLLGTEEIRDVMAFLNLLGEEEEEISLARILLGSFVGIHPEEYRDLARWASREKKSSLFRLLGNIEECSFLSPASKKKIASLFEKVSKLKRTRGRLDLDELFWEIAFQFRLFSGYLHKGSAAAEKAVQHLGQFCFLMKEFQEDAQAPKKTLGAFLKHLVLAEELGLAPDTEAAAAEPTNAVRLLTIHAAKGLEFPIVFLPCLTQGRFPTRQKQDFLPFPDALVKEALPEGDFHIEEERRLFYVGLTRAEQKLNLSTVEKPRVKPSVFVKELLGGELKDRIEHTVHEEETSLGIQNNAEDPSFTSYAPLFRLIRSLEKDSNSNLKKEVSLVLEAFLKCKGSVDSLSEKEIESVFDLSIEKLLGKAKESLLEPAPSIEEPAPTINLPAKLSLSHSQIETYEWCPLKYQFHYIYRIPERKNPHLAFGNNIHKALEDFYRLLEADPNPDVNLLLELYEKAWRSQGFKNSFQEKTYKDKGFEILKTYFEDNKNNFHLESPFIEEGFLIKINDSLEIKGKIDRVQKIDGSVMEVIDYKTGKAKDQKYADASSQLSIYAMALKEMSPIPVGPLSFYYLESRQKVSTEVSDERIEETKNKIVETGQKIRDAVFPPCPEADRYIKCKLCDYKPMCPVWEQ